MIQHGLSCKLLCLIVTLSVSLCMVMAWKAWMVGHLIVNNWGPMPFISLFRLKYLCYCLFSYGAPCPPPHFYLQVLSIECFVWIRNEISFGLAYIIIERCKRVYISYHVTIHITIRTKWNGQSSHESECHIRLKATSALHNNKCHCAPIVCDKLWCGINTFLIYNSCLTVFFQVMLLL